jgi:two-component system, chemotaxis family, protein-glutamate methylesterase/glutaminase
MEPPIRLIIIGGSWGGIQASMAILKDLPGDFPIPILLVLHRLKNVDSNLGEVYGNKLALKVREVEEKERPEAGTLYIAPANYHVLLEKDHTFSLDVSQPENYSRPSIDVTLRSAAAVYGPALAGIILSGANKDGSAGLEEVVAGGGLALVQAPEEAEVSTMPQAAIALIPDKCLIFRLEEIQRFLFSLA